MFRMSFKIFSSRLATHLSTKTNKHKFSINYVQCVKNLKYYSTQIAKKDQLNEILGKYNLEINKFNTATRERLNCLNIEDVDLMIKNLHDFGIESPRIIEALDNYEDWSVFDRELLKEKFESFRHMNFAMPLVGYLVARNEQIMHLNEKTIGYNYSKLFEYFSRGQLEILLKKSPKLLTNDIYSFRYKFYYVYFIMNIKQDAMCTSLLFNYPIEYIRERHLFLARSGFYDR